MFSCIVNIMISFMLLSLRKLLSIQILVSVSKLVKGERITGVLDLVVYSSIAEYHLSGGI